MKILPVCLSFAAGASLLLGGCARQAEPIPTALTAAGNPAAGRALLAQCLRAHGGRAAYERLHDVNVRYDGKWAALGPRLQPVLSDTGFRGGSEERYLIGRGGFTVGQHHHGAEGEKWVFHAPETEVAVGYRRDLWRDIPEGACGIGIVFPGEGEEIVRSSDADTLAAAALVVDAYTSFLFGPYFFEKRGAFVQKLDAGIVVAGRPCDEVLAILRPGFGKSPEDRVVLCIDREDHLLRRVQFTLDGLESTRGAEVQVDLMDHRWLAGVWWPTAFHEHIERPVNLPAHRWRMTGFDTGRGYAARDLMVDGRVGFKGRAMAPTHDIQ